MKTIKIPPNHRILADVSEVKPKFLKLAKSLVPILEVRAIDGNPPLTSEELTLISDEWACWMDLGSRLTKKEYISKGIVIGFVAGVAVTGLVTIYTLIKENKKREK
jgi:hypothetical protein